MRVHPQLRAAAEGLPLPRALRPQRRVLYFDIDGSLVRQTFDRAKHALAGGRFERAARGAGFDELVCVSDAVILCRVLFDALPRHRDPHAGLFRFCRGTFEDEAWFHRNVRMVLDPVNRAAEIDLEADWYYFDDHAGRYLQRAGISPCAARGRVLQCRPDSEGHEVVAWIEGLAVQRRAAGPLGTARIPSRLPAAYSDAWLSP